MSTIKQKLGKLLISTLPISRENFDILRCKNCSLRYQSTPKKYESLETLYNNIYEENPPLLIEK